MKICLKCGRDYVDDLRFCLEDGTPLTLPFEAEKITERKTEEFEEKTIVRPPRTVAVGTRSASSNKLGIVAVVVVLLIGVLALLGAGIGGFLYYSSTLKQTAELDETRDERPENINAGTANSPVTLSANSNKPASNSADTKVPVNLKVVDLKTEPGNGPPPNPPSIPTPPKGNIPKVISGGVLNGKALSLPKPPYPPAAKAVRAGGSVSVQVLIDEQGNVLSANAVSGHPLLRAAAASAARAAKFQPTLLSGQAVKVSGVVTYNFVPDAPAKYD